jgi:predicted dehydrogenase
MSRAQVTMIGGGMIAHDQLLPSLYHLQRQGVIGEIWVCSQHGRSLKALAEAETLRRAFPGQSFRAVPDLSGDLEAPHPELYRDVISRMQPGNVVVVAVPDQLHYDVVMTALRAGQHVLAVKPLVLTARESEEIEREARGRGLVVGIEYHKRFDDRSFLARRRYQAGLFGEFKLGTACLLEKWYYRHSNFQNWFTCENSDAFTYIGCHYVDLVAFITGLEPVAVSVYGLRDRFPNGNEGYLWTDARVIWSNGACLNVQNALGFPDEGPGTNTQGLTMYCAGGSSGAWLVHSDQYRGLQYCYTKRPEGPGATVYAEPSPDYFQYVDLGGPGLVPVGYGYRSVEYIVKACLRAAAEPDLARRQAILKEYDDAGVMATPANSRYNERVIEAARKSLQDGGREVRLER